MALLEKIRASTAGALEHVNAIVAGDRRIFARVLREHTKLITLVTEIEKQDVTSAVGLEKRRELYELLRRELFAHSEAEREAVYPVLCELRGAQKSANWCVKEHLEVEAEARRLETLDVASTAFTQQLGRVRRQLEQHRRREEDELFRIAERELPEARQKAVQKAYLEVRARIFADLERPAAPTTPAIAETH